MTSSASVNPEEVAPAYPCFLLRQGLFLQTLGRRLEMGKLASPGGPPKKPPPFFFFFFRTLMEGEAELGDQRAPERMPPPRYISMRPP